jgi:Ca2+-binding RTX toxin-like protein
MLVATLATWLPILAAGGTNAAQHCTIKGTGGDDRIVGTREADSICGFAGNDTILSGPGRDRV